MKFKKGDKFVLGRCKLNKEFVNNYRHMTIGKIYEVTEIDGAGDALYVNDHGTSNYINLYQEAGDCKVTKIVS